MNQSQLLKLGKEKLKKEDIEEDKAKRLLEFVLQQSRAETIRNSLEEVSKEKEKEYQEKLKRINSSTIYRSFGRTSFSVDTKYRRKRNTDIRFMYRKWSDCYFY